VALPRPPDEPDVYQQASRIRASRDGDRWWTRCRIRPSLPGEPLVD